MGTGNRNARPRAVVRRGSSRPRSVFPGGAVSASPLNGWGCAARQPPSCAAELALAAGTVGRLRGVQLAGSRQAADFVRPARADSFGRGSLPRYAVAALEMASRRRRNPVRPRPVRVCPARQLCVVTGVALRAASSQVAPSCSSTPASGTGADRAHGRMRPPEIPPTRWVRPLPVSRASWRRSSSARPGQQSDRREWTSPARPASPTGDR
jgi:hypothetical protein